MSSMSDETQLPKPRFKRGDRVLMVRHGDWKTEATGTITGGGRPRKLYDGSIDREYWIVFDEPQRDHTDEKNGVNLAYDESNVLERYLSLLDERGA
jgi:hypothetical protein